jgi:hypothetical protein
MATRIFLRANQSTFTEVRSLEKLVPMLREHFDRSHLVTLRIGDRHIDTRTIKNALEDHADDDGAVLRALDIDRLA